MKKTFIVPLVAAALLPLKASAAQQLKGEVFSPEQGIVCDKKSGFCADSEGISLGYTGEYLGENAMQKFEKIMSGDFDRTYFVLSNGVACNT